MTKCRSLVFKQARFLLQTELLNIHDLLCIIVVRLLNKLIPHIWPLQGTVGVQSSFLVPGLSPCAQRTHYSPCRCVGVCASFPSARVISTISKLHVCVPGTTLGTSDEFYHLIFKIDGGTSNIPILQLGRLKR